MSTTKLIGHKRLIEDIRRWIHNVFDSQMINLIGPRGSGKSKIIDYVREQVNSTETAWADKINFRVIQFSGASFPREGVSLIQFLNDQIRDQWSDWKNDKPDILSVKNQMRLLMDGKQGLLIMIDEANRMIEYSTIEECQALIALRMPYVQFIIASDYRGIKLYDRSSSENSKSFFSVSHAYFVNPLYKDDAYQLIHNIYLLMANGTEDVLDEKDVELIYELAGGYSGLIQGVMNHLIRECEELPSNGLSPMFKQNHLLKRALPSLPRDAQISELLEEMALNIGRQDPNTQAMLLDIVSGHFDEKPQSLWKTEFAGHQREDELYMLELLAIDSRGYDPRSASLLAQFTMLRYLTPTLSKIEFALFELCAHSSSIVEYERIYNLVSTIYPNFSNDEEADKLKFVANVFSRIRTKSGGQANGRAFEIDNHQGRGYHLKWLVDFYEFYEDREESFAPVSPTSDKSKNQNQRIVKKHP